MKKITIIIVTGLIFLTILLVVLISLLRGTIGEIEPDWHRTWGGTDNDYGYAITECNGYLYVLSKTWGHHGPTGLSLLKYDTNGNIIWEETWGGSMNDQWCDFVSYNDYLYIVGANDGYGGRSDDVLILRYDTDGNLIWQRTWDNGDDEYGYSITEYGGFLYIVGRSYQSYNEQDLLLLKYDTDGNQIWTTIWSGWNTSWGYNIVGNKGFLYVLSRVVDYDQNEYDQALLKYDTNGNLIWVQICAQGYFADNINKRLLAYDGAIYITSSNLIQGYFELLLIKYDLNGNLLWSRAWSRCAYSSNVGQSITGYNGYLYVMGTTSMNISSNRDLILLKYDTNGNMEWVKKWGEEGVEDGDQIITHDGYLYLIGETESYGSGEKDVLIMKINTFEISPYWGAVIIIFGIIIALIADIFLTRRSKKVYLKKQSKNQVGKMENASQEFLDDEGEKSISEK